MYHFPVNSTAQKLKSINLKHTHTPPSSPCTPGSYTRKGFPRHPNPVLGTPALSCTVMLPGRLILDTQRSRKSALCVPQT